MRPVGHIRFGWFCGRDRARAGRVGVWFDDFDGVTTMISKTGVKAHDDVVVSSESMAIATTQAQIVTAAIVFYRACLASKITNGLDAGNEIIALKNLGATV